jgi:hypothetical protein
MNRVYWFVLSLLLLFFPTLGYAQVDVSKSLGRDLIAGNWMFDSKKSFGPDSEHKGEQLMITYEDPRLTIKRTLTLKKETKSATIILFTDKRGEKTNPFPFTPSQELSSTTEWQNNILVRLYSIDQTGNPRHVLQMKESYELKDGGNVLVVTITPFPRSRAEALDLGFPRELVLKRVYKRIV